MSGGLTDSPDDVYILHYERKREAFLKFCFGEKEGMEWGKERGRNFKKHHNLIAFCPYILHPAIRSKKEEVCFVFVIIIFNLAEVNHIQTTSLAIVILSCISNLGETQHVGIRPRSGNPEEEAMALVGGVWEPRRENTDISHLEASWRAANINRVWLPCFSNPWKKPQCPVGLHNAHFPLFLVCLPKTHK